MGKIGLIIRERGVGKNLQHHGTGGFAFTDTAGDGHGIGVKREDRIRNVLRQPFICACAVCPAGNKELCLIIPEGSAESRLQFFGTGIICLAIQQTGGS